MKFYQLSILALTFTLLAACSTSTPSPAPQASPTIRPPQIETSPIATPTLPPEPTATEPLPYSTATVAPTEPPAASVPTTVAATAPATAEATQPPDSPAVAAQACTNIASFYGDITIPDGTTFRQGDSFRKSWKIRNDGTCTWDSSYALVFAGGEMMNGPQSSPLPDVPPGSAAEISADLTAPNRGGTYQSNWQFQSPTGDRFGVGFGQDGLIWVQIAVSFVDSSGEPAQSTPAPGVCAATRDTAVEAQVLALINQVRTKQGLPALIAQEQLNAAALKHSMDMACNNFVDHVGTDGTLWYDRVSALGYANYNSARENIYVGNPQFGGTADGAFNWWWNSQIHHDNLMDSTMKEIGVAYVFDANSDYGGYYTTVFARP